jgi:UDP-N-acetylglucosamine 2-epimerase
VRVLLVGNSEEASGLAESLDGEAVAVEHRPDESPPAGGPEEIAAIAHELREFERVLGEDGPDAVLVGSASAAALAAVLVATKLGTPVAAVASGGQDPHGVNARLIRQLSDAQVAPEPAAVVNWLRGTYTERP